MFANNPTPQYNQKIVEIIEKYISLQKKGRDYIGLCPFHDDSSPSLSVSPSKNCWKCFSCGAGGKGGYSFVAKLKNISYFDAVALVDGKPKPDFENFSFHPDDKTFNILASFFQFGLLSIDLSQIPYISQRRYDFDTIEKFQLGLLDNNHLINDSLIESKNLDEDLISKSKIRNLNNRLIFPIKNENERVVGFVGRDLTNNNQNPKYLISTGFEKQKHLYNINLCQKVVLDYNFVVLTEGMTDTIALSLKGYDNSVSLMGVEISQEQIKSLKNLSNNVVIALDNDQPGQKATLKLAKKLWNEGFNIKIMFPTENKDWEETLRNLSDFSIDFNSLDSASAYISKHDPSFDLQKAQIKSKIEKCWVKNKNGVENFDIDKFCQTIRDYFKIKKYQNEFYIDLGDKYEKNFEFIFDFICQTIGKTFNINTKREIKSVMWNWCPTIDQNDIPKRSFRAKNGIFTYNELLGMFISDSSEVFIPNILNFNYDPDFQQSEKINTFLSQISLKDELLEKNILEAFSLSLIQSNEFSKMFVLKGSAGNGKSVLTDVVSNILGKQNCSSVSISSFKDMSFGMGNLLGKLANFDNDMNSELLINPSVIKKITGDDDVTLNRKYQKPLEGKINAQIYFCTNQFPTIIDNSKALERRLVVIPFKYIVKNPDRKLKDKLLEKKDVFGSMLVASLENVLKNDFVLCQKIIDETESCLTDNDNIKLFLIDKSNNYNMSAADYIDGQPTKELYADYRVFCDENDLIQKGKKAFNANISDNFNMYRKTRRVNSRIFEAWFKNKN